MPDPVAELRTAAEALTADPTPALHHHVGAWLTSVADRMALGGWVGSVDRNRALKVARAVDRCPATWQGQRCTLDAGSRHLARSNYTIHEIRDPAVPGLRHFTDPPQPRVSPDELLGIAPDWPPLERR
ncbi:hypothetical protein [Embleya sp. NPDC001921]